MPKTWHEVLDPIHGFIHYTPDEQRIIDSRPIQRLRSIRQLGLGCLLYPGGTQTRFEHSLGVMDLAGRAFDVITALNAIANEVRDFFPEIVMDERKIYWRSALRVAALCHDVGHPPFSHSAERLFPPAWNHERMTKILIESPSMQSIWKEMNPPLNPEHIVKLAVGPKKGKELGLYFTRWEEILSEIITGDTFGVDRIDYLLRDAYHVGVASGRFDYARLIETLRILVPRDERDTPLAPVLGIQKGGRYSAYALLVARRFMYTQVYFHPVNRSYTLHLVDFLSQWLPEGRLPIDPVKHLTSCDDEVVAALLRASSDETAAGHDAARRIMSPGRKHFRLLYEPEPGDREIGPINLGSAVYAAACGEFGAQNLRHEKKVDKVPGDFFVELRDGTIKSSSAFPGRSQTRCRND